MLNIFLIIICIVVSYLLGSINGAIIISNLVYHQDIRTLGSKNAGFTNFKRVYGMNKYTGLMFAIDVLKAMIPTIVFGFVFASVNNEIFCFQFGAALSMVINMLGHCFPIYYGFKGGKAFLTFASTIWFVNWQVGLIALVVFAIFIFGPKYMSLAAMASSVSCPISLIIIDSNASLLVVIFVSFAASIIVIRHKANIIRLFHHTESKFSFFNKK